MAVERFHGNGVNGVTGRYQLPTLTAEQIARLALGESSDVRGLRRGPSEEVQELRTRMDSLQPRFGVYSDPNDLGDTGWGLIVARDVDPAVLEALAPLIEHRRAAAMGRFRTFSGDYGYRPGLLGREFLARQRKGPGPLDPDRVPYYLLIVGSPEAIPFEFQQALSVQYAVGRLHFATLEQYANYARMVVDVV
jgi:hypothetical protein